LMISEVEASDKIVADPRWLESLALWLDEADRLLREAAKNGLLVNRRDGRDMTPEEVQSRIIAHSDNGAQQELRAIAERTREALVHVKGGEDV
jgi:hypothetical protein